ncbi:naaladl1 [Pungitius sinensis]
MIKQVLFGILGGALVLTAGILIGHYGIAKSDGSREKDLDESLVHKFLSEVDNIQIEQNLRELTKVPHMATTAGDEQTVQLMLKRWQDPDSGLDQAWREEYLVYLSFPDPTKPNKVTVVNATADVLYTAREKEKVYTEDQKDPEVVQPYAAYSPPGEPKGKLVYANQGKPDDYKLLNETVDLRGTIAITRYGGAGRADKAINAAPYGVVGVLVYTDPLDINDGLMSDASETYPHSWYMPPSGVERGSFNTRYGDMLTPYLAAKEETYRIPVENITGIPPIPIQPIGFEDAEKLICELGGTEAPVGWRGAFKCTYNFGGPGFKPTSAFKDSDVKLAIFNTAGTKNSSNVMGVIRGSEEPDRYVIYGNHRDSWVHGAIDPSSGTSVMLELTRVLGRMVKKGTWRPRRSIIFGSWGAEEFGLIGSAEYAEQYFAKLSERTVAYINVDIAVFANATLRASGMPSLQNVIFKAAKQVDAPGLGATSVYDNWIRYANRTSSAHGPVPSHQAIARTAGNVLIRLADSLLLPLNCSDYAESLEDYLDTAVTLYQTQMQAWKISMEPLKRAVASFRSAATHLDQVIRSSDPANETPLKVRRINDQLMLLDRAFLDPLAFPDKHAYRHVIWAPSSAGKPTFPGLADAFANAETTGQAGDWAKVHYHLSVLSQAIEGAAHTLVDVI